MDRISVLIPDVDEWLSLPVAYCLKISKRVDVHGLSRRKSRPLRLSNLFATFEDVEKFDLNSWLTRIDEIAARRQIDVVLPVSSAAIRALSEHRRALACSSKLVQLPEPSTFDTATNKAALAAFLAAHGFPQPQTVVVTAGVAPPGVISDLAFPVLAKPPLSSGGVGIRVFQNLKDLGVFLTGEGKETDWVVQEFVQGTDLGVNVLCQDGQIIASTVQHAIIPSSTPYRSATCLDFRPDPAAMDLAARLVKTLGWSGVANIDMRLDRRRNAPLLFELNGRYWLSLLGSLKAGVNFPLLACEAAIGQTKSNRQPRQVRYFGESGNALLSLLGGGRFRVRPRETDLKYLVRDPAFFIAILLARVAKISRDKLSSMRAAIRWTGG